MTTPTDPIPIGRRVRITRPDNPRSFRKDQVGTVESGSWHLPPGAAPRMFLWVRFPASAGAPASFGAFGTAAWLDEVTILPDERQAQA